MSCPHAHRIGQVLQFAVAVALAGLAVLGVVVQQQFDDIAAGLADVGRVGLHLHALPNLLTARCHVKPHPLDLDHAHATGTLQAQVGMVAEPRDADPQLLAGLHDRRAVVNGHGRAVDRQRDFFRVHVVIMILLLRFRGTTPTKYIEGIFGNSNGWSLVSQRDTARKNHLRQSPVGRSTSLCLPLRDFGVYKSALASPVCSQLVGK